MADEKKLFSGQRLRIARSFRGRTQADLGAALNISQQFIGEVERGSQPPSVQLVRAFGDLLGFQPDFFYGENLNEFVDSECNFRKRRTTPISIRIRALAFGTLLGQFWSYANGELNLPSERIPNLTATHRSEIEKAADRCRMEWGLGLDTPISNIVHVVEYRAGVPIARFNGVGEKVDAFSRAGKPSVIVLSSKPASRCRSDLAHECAHLVLHRNRLTGIPEVEREADHFARALLLPRAGFRREFPHSLTSAWEVLFRLKARWRASLADMIQRANDLSLINGVEYLRLYKELSRQGWLKTEPFEFDSETPEILPAVFEELRRTKSVDHSGIADVLGWTTQTLVQVTSVPTETNNAAKVFSLRPRETGA
jgi:Zn-dependent peptidase ImmA (M78 family)/transcriptional regulator with XRE-family HTH domain